VQGKGATAMRNAMPTQLLREILTLRVTPTSPYAQGGVQAGGAGQSPHAHACAGNGSGPVGHGCHASRLRIHVRASQLRAHALS